MVDTYMIQMLIRKKGLTDKQVACLLGITPTTLSNKLHNKKSFLHKEVVMLANILEVSPASPIFYEENINAEENEEEE